VQVELVGELAPHPGEVGELSGLSQTRGYDTVQDNLGHLVDSAAVLYVFERWETVSMLLPPRLSG
jgi:hypothetical protein